MKIHSAYNNIDITRKATNKLEEDNTFSKILDQNKEGSNIGTKNRDSYLSTLSDQKDNYFIYQNDSAISKKLAKATPDQKDGAKEKTEEDTKQKEEESETKSKIEVRPDGSRVLVVTTKVGGMTANMNIEISKPTMMPTDQTVMQEEAAEVQGEEI